MTVRISVVLLLGAAASCHSASDAVFLSEDDLAEIVAFRGEAPALTSDDDGDGIANATPDNCAGIPNPVQRDLDGDGFGDLCDLRPSRPDGVRPSPRGLDSVEAFNARIAALHGDHELAANEVAVTVVRVCRGLDQGPFAKDFVNIESAVTTGEPGAQAPIVARATPDLSVGYQRLIFTLPGAEMSGFESPEHSGDLELMFWDDLDGDGFASADEPTLRGNELPGYGTWRGQTDDDQVGLLIARIPSAASNGFNATGNCGGDYPEDCPPSPEDPGCDDEISSPLVIDTADDGFAPFSAPEVSFDLIGDGNDDLVGWPTDPEDAFLALDIDGDGLVSGGHELFGNNTRLADGTRAANGFDALAEHDNNDDRRIDADDPAFEQLLLWHDVNGDGRSQTDELVRVVDSRITGISLAYLGIEETDAHGNVTKQRASYSYHDATGRERAALVIDVWFAMKRSPADSQVD